MTVAADFFASYKARRLKVHRFGRLPGTTRQLQLQPSALRDGSGNMGPMIGRAENKTDKAGRTCKALARARKPMRTVPNVYTVKFDDSRLARKLSEVEKRLLPGVVVEAVNATGFQVRDRWKTRVPEIFDQPTPFTLNAVLYTRATTTKPTADVFFRVRAAGGTPPAKYLQPQEQGGLRRQKAFERRLQVLPISPRFYMPGKLAPLDQFGNLGRGLLGRILSQIGRAASDGGEHDANETAAGRQRRLRRQRRKGGGGSFFVLGKRRGKLRAGVVYERINDLEIGGPGARATSKVRAVLFPLSTAPRYSKRLNAIAIARGIARDRFPKNFAFFMRRALGQAAR